VIVATHRATDFETLAPFVVPLPSPDAAREPA
jgi:hypothetical protein